MSSVIIIKFLWVLWFLPVLIASIPNNQDNACGAQQTCSSCLQTPKCVWCSELHNSTSFTRCGSRDRYEKEKSKWCAPEHVVGHATSVEILKDEPFHAKINNDTVQVRPQHVRIQLRRGEETTIYLRYSKAEDYPVDLYYLMDLSASMEPYRNQLSKLGDKLAESMKKLTSNFRLGFGSFVDKVILPMTNTRFETTCVLESGKRCAAPYEYKHQMSLTENLSLFKSQVKEAPISGNLDAPEGGFDAIMQSIVCTKEIGWRKKARHLLVYSTDASYHMAGDGRLAGIVEPNDELCHLDKKGFYTHSLLQDYPSVSQINRNARDHNVNIIFAVTKNMNETYQLLSKRISGSSIGLLENDAKNVVDLVSNEYEKLVESVIISDNAPKMINVRYFSKCLNESSSLKERRDCEGLRVDNVVEFKIVLKALDCPANIDERKQTINIGPRDLSEHLQLDVEIICDCPCELPENQVKKSAMCKGNGNLICGICSCNDEFYGKQCECKRTDLGTNNLDDCRSSNEIEICSGRGSCKCGVCECTKRLNEEEEFYGVYCECDNFSCPRIGGLICGGRGKCECGTCTCLPGWTGATCDCKDSNSTCMPLIESNVVCSGKGDCVCGSCVCHEIENVRYSGQFCDECPTCPGHQCEELKDCVECYAYKSGRLWNNSSHCNDCPHKIEMIKVDQVDELYDKSKAINVRMCRLPVDGGCNILFNYEPMNGLTNDVEKFYKIYARKEKDCPKPLNIMGVALGVVISTVILGFAILLTWKVITMIHDRREYAKFEKDKILVRWDRSSNPFYKKATTTFNNPTFKNTANQQTTASNSDLST